MKKVSNTARIFFEYSYRGDGKYYTTEQGSRNYRNTTFQAWANYNSDCFDIIERGNDAPRGGQTGDFVVVKFNSDFQEKWGAYLDEKREAETQAKKIADERTTWASKEGPRQEKELRKIFETDQEFRDKIIDRIENYSSKDWRGWVKMKVAKKIGLTELGNLLLSPPEIREMAYENIK